MKSAPMDGPGLLRASRERFLATGHVPAAGVREEIAASWRRSKLNGVSPDRLEVPYEPDQVNNESRLCRAANPVMQRFAARLIDTPTGLFLADREARGVGRWVGVPMLADKFDAVGAANGFRFDEEIAGTNALGTTIELGRPTKITASEHWVEQLSALTCAGAPIRNPITRQIEGMVDLTCVNEHNADLLLALVLEIAHQIEERFYLDTSVTERLMLQNFSSAARNSSRPVLALNQDMVLTNPAAARLLRGMDQELLWDLAARVMHADRPLVEVLSQGEQDTIAHCTPIRDGAEVVGVTVELKREAAGRPSLRSSSPPSVDLPGLVGRSPAWRGVCQQVRNATAPGRPLVVTGETGVGKRAVAEVWCRLRGATDLLVLDAATDEVDLDRVLSASAVVLAHVDRLPVPVASALGAADLRDMLVAVTVSTGAEPVSEATAELLDRIGGTRVEITPLRSRHEDVVDLVAALAGGATHVTSELTQTLMRMPWNRNVRELASVLDAARAHRPSGALRPEDLPQHVRRAAGKRTLTTLEQAEVDTIVRALDDAGGNKVDAAAALGISRSTLYRKMHTYGLDLDRAVF